VKIKIYKMKLQFFLLLFMFVKPGLLHWGSEMDHGFWRMGHWEHLDLGGRQ